MLEEPPSTLFTPICLLNSKQSIAKSERIERKAYESYIDLADQTWRVSQG